MYQSSTAAFKAIFCTANIIYVYRPTFSMGPIYQYCCVLHILMVRYIRV